jgi:hypothetical protein
MGYYIEEVDARSNRGLALRGAGRQMWGYQGAEVMLAGPAETGKTMASLAKCHAMLLKYPGCQGAVVRKTYASMQGSVLASYENKILGKDVFKKIVKPYGGEKPEWYDYPNGSRLWVGGLDNPDKVLSSERDFVYVNQAEEIELKQWEYLQTRTTGRAGNMPYAQVLGDCNPGPPNHWIINRATLKVFHSKHEDNPMLFDENGRITEQGIRTLAVLDSTTGVTKQRLRYGIWAGAEGIIYDQWDINKHIITRAEMPICHRRYEVVDFGYTNPFCWQNIYMDNDGRMYVSQEIYYTQRLVEDHAKKIVKLVKGQITPEVIICDTDAEDRATFERYRKIKTKGAEKLGVRDGIEEVQARLKIQGDGKPRFFYVADALVEKDQKLVDLYKPTSSREEVGVYVWNEKKDAPEKEFDHGMDGWRYGIRHYDRRRGKKRRSVSYSFGSA